MLATQSKGVKQKTFFYSKKKQTRNAFEKNQNKTNNLLPKGFLRIFDKVIRWPFGSQELLSKLSQAFQNFYLCLNTKLIYSKFHKQNMKII